MSWDAFQRDVLAELGHVPYVTRHARTAAAEVDAGMLARAARAAGIAVEDLQAHADILAMVAVLRGNVSAKRALWPRLRALRRVAR